MFLDHPVKSEQIKHLSEHGHSTKKILANHHSKNFIFLFFKMLQKEIKWTFPQDELSLC